MTTKKPLQYFTTKEDLNLAFHVGDDIKSVNFNHYQLSKKLNYNLNTLIYMKQIHSNIVHIINENDTFKTPPICDALITDKINTPLMVMVADCSALLFFDKNRRVIAVAHAGRAGAFSNIVQNVIDTFTKHFNSNTQDISVTIGASIGECCYEVGEEIYAEAKTLDLEYALSKRDNSYYLNISKILKTQLLNAGVDSKNIVISNECTSCFNDKYFSYRANPKDGRFAGIISL